MNLEAGVVVGGVIVPADRRRDGDVLLSDEDVALLHSEWFGAADAPLLFRAINLGHWDICRRLLEAPPEIVREQIEFIDQYGYTALHYGCWDASAPMEVMEHILSVCPPDFASKPNKKGRTALHLAAWSGPSQIVELVARKFPEAASVLDRNLKSPLYDACSRNRGTKVIKALIEADPSQVSKSNKNGRSPCFMMFRVSYGSLYSGLADTSREALLERVTMMLKAQHETATKAASPTTELDDWTKLLLAIRNPNCPFAYVKLLMESMKEVPWQKDDETLLHISLRSKPFHSRQFFRCDRCHERPSGLESDQFTYMNKEPFRSHWGVRCQNCLDSGSSLGLNVSQYTKVNIEHKHRELVKYILDKAPHLKNIPDKDGTYPLSIALSEGVKLSWFTGGVKELVQAVPSSLVAMDRRTGLYPFLLAAMDIDCMVQLERPAKKRRFNMWVWDDRLDEQEDEENSRNQLTTIFHLLKECPTLLDIAIPP